MTQDKVDAVLIDEQTLDLQELASACAVPAAWVVERVEAGLLACCSSSAGEMRFASAHLVRARRMVTTERCFDANQELAALVADLLEEVEQLRRQLQATAKSRATNI
jgi:chaperone modulatory protein CbpM